MQAVLPRAVLVHLDYCRFGMPWQKSTTFAAWLLPALMQVNMVCKPCGKLCSSTHRPHKRLEGRAQGGANWTAIAEPYPWRLVHRIADVVGEAAHAASSQATCGSSSNSGIRQD